MGMSWIILIVICFTILLYSCLCVPAFSSSRSEYLALRNGLLAEEASRVIGANLVLSEKELEVDRILLEAKRTEFERGFHEPFAPGVNFLLGRHLVESSKVFDIIRRMPKGGILHAHESIADIKWVIDHVTYSAHLYFCICDDVYESLRFKFSLHVPPERGEGCVTDWRLVSEAREETGSAAFDKMLYHKMTMYNADGNNQYANGTMAWRRFERSLWSTIDLYFTTGHFKAFVKQALKQLVEDNVQYLELRTLLQPLEELDGTLHPREYTLQQYIEAIEEFTRDHQDSFVGAKLIFHSVRVPFDRTRIFEEVKNSIEFRKKYPDYIVGYDLVAQEDLGGPLIDYIDSLLYVSGEDVDLPFFFHAGETNWQGTSIDENMVDAFLLNTSRIAHGYAINKHPVVLEMFKSRGIAIEINPISNQVLGLVHDLRNHIGTSLIAEGHHVVISSDDPAPWGALPLSHDYYMAFMGMSGKNVGLRLLKQLALNTFEYSTMNEAEKETAIKLWQAKWDEFLDEILSSSTESYGDVSAKHAADDDLHRQEL